MKHNLIKCTLFSFVMTLCLLLGFTSCENFLTGQDIRREIEDAIAYNNAASCNLIFREDPGTGEFYGSKERTVKKGYETEIQFELNSQDYVFVTLEVVSQNDKLVSRADCVELTKVKTVEEERGLYTYKIKLIKQVNDVLIHPVCIERPSVIGHTPANSTESQFSNIPIEITFNMPMEALDVKAEDSIFNYENISLTYKNTTDMSEYFLVPYFDSEKKVLNLVPDGLRLQKFISDKGIPYADIRVSFSENIAVTVNEKVLALKQDPNSNFSVRYIAKMEEDPPTRTTFFVSKEKITLENAADFTGKKFVEGSVDQITADVEKIKQNRTNGKVYIYGQYYDKDSGVKKVTVTEKRTKNKAGNAVTENAVSTEYDSNNASFITDKDGNTDFVIEYNINAEDGAMQITVAVEDAGTNHDAKQDASIVAIKDSQMSFEDIRLFNEPNAITNFYFDTEQGTLNSEGDPVAYPILQKKVYGDYSILFDDENVQVYILYKDKDGKDARANFEYTTRDSEFEYHYEYIPCTIHCWKTTLKGLDTESAGGKELTLVVIDDLGNKSQKKYSIPNKPVPATVIQDEYTGGYLLYFTQQEEDDVVHLYKDNYENPVVDVTGTKIEEGHNYVVQFSKAQMIFGPKSEQFTTNFEHKEITPPQGITITYTKHPELEDTTIISVNIPEESRNNYDYLYYKVDDANNTQVVFEEEALSASFTYRTFYLYKSPLKITLYGGKGDKVFVPQELYTEVLTGEEFDNCPPILISDDFLYSDYTSLFPSERKLDMYEYFYLGYVSEYGSQVDCFTLQPNLGQTILRYPAQAYITEDVPFTGWYGIEYRDLVVLPVWDLDEDEYFNLDGAQDESDGYNDGYYPFGIVKNITCVYDTAGNVEENTDWGAYIKFNLVPKVTCTKSRKDSNTVNCKASLSSKAAEIGLVYYELVENAETGKMEWVEPEWDPDLGQVNVYSFTTNTTEPRVEKSLSHTFTFNKGKIYKIIAVSKNYPYIRNSTLNTNNKDDYGFSDPVYVCVGPDTSTINSSGKYDYILPMAGTKKAVLISSDSTTFVHTLVTKKPYDECKDWDAEKWEHHRRHIGDCQMDFTPSEHSPQKYTIPTDDMDSGDCYVVVAHFADGTCAISDVMQKP